MRFNTIPSILVAVSGLASAAPLEARQDTCPVATVGDYVWKISKFVARKPENTHYNMVSFQVTTTNPGSSLDINCVARAPALPEDLFTQCENYSGFSFAFSDEYSTLVFKYGDTANAAMGTTVVPNVCRAGGNGPNDRVCEGVRDSYIALVKFPH